MNVLRTIDTFWGRKHPQVHGKVPTKAGQSPVSRTPLGDLRTFLGGLGQIEAVLWSLVAVLSQIFVREYPNVPAGSSK